MTSDQRGKPPKVPDVPDPLDPASRANRIVGATIIDVARACGLSIKTVSRVMNREPNVRPETRDKVMQAVQQLSYAPQISARSLKGTKSFLVGMFFDVPSPYVAQLQLGAAQRCRALGYHLVVDPLSLGGTPSLDDFTHALANVRYDAAVLTAPVVESDEVMTMLEARNTPFVRIAPSTALDRAPRVFIDDEAAMFEVTEHIIKLGHRRIGFVIGHPDHGASKSRHDGFRKAMAAHKVAIDESLVAQGDFNFSSGREAAEKLLSARKPPTAIISSNDEMASGILGEAQRRGLKVPHDLSIVGFDDSTIASMTWPTMTTVRQPVADLAAVAIDLAFGLSGEDWPPGTTINTGKYGHRSAQLAHQLIVRHTCAPPPGSK